MQKQYHQPCSVCQGCLTCYPHEHGGYKFLQKFVLSFILLTFVAIIGPPSSDACKIRDAKGRLVETDCQGAFIWIGADDFIYALITEKPEGFIRSRPGQFFQYFTTPDCQGVGQGEGLSYSRKQTDGWFYEIADYVDATHFYFAGQNGHYVGGSQVRSEYDWFNSICTDTTGWWDDSVVFAPTSGKAISASGLTPPFKMVK